MKVNTVALTEVINLCIESSMNLSIPEAQRREFLVAGRRLRGSLINLLTVIFPEGTDAVIKANKDLKTVNEHLKAAESKLDNAASIVADLASLTVVLDDLLKIAVAIS